MLFILQQFTFKVPFPLEIAAMHILLTAAK